MLSNDNISIEEIRLHLADKNNIDLLDRYWRVYRNIIVRDDFNFTVFVEELGKEGLV